MNEYRDSVKIEYFEDANISDIKSIIKKHVEKYGDFWPDELAYEHNLSVFDTLTACDELAEEGYLESKSKDKVPRKEREE